MHTAHTNLSGSFAFLEPESTKNPNHMESRRNVLDGCHACLYKHSHLSIFQELVKNKTLKRGEFKLEDIH